MAELADNNMKDLNSWLVEAEEKHPSIKQARAKWAADKAKITFGPI